MIPVRVQITYSKDLLPKIKGIRAEAKQILQDAIRVWHKQMLPDHFKPGAYQKYPGAGLWKARGMKYTRYKVRKYGDEASADLVFSGRTKRTLLSTINVSGTAKRAHGRMPETNRTLNFSNRGNMPNMREEVLVLNQSEANALEKYISDRFRQFIDAHTVKRAVRIATLW